MIPNQSDKAGLHILLKLACLVVILAGIHAAADIIVQLLLALFFAIVLNPLVTWFLRRGISRPVAITIVVIVMMIALTALFGVLAASLSEFSTMLPQYNKELTRKIVSLQEMMPFLNLHISPERMLRRMDSEKVMTYATTLMTGLSGAMASILLLVMTVVFMLFEVRHVPYKLRFALNNPQIHIAGLPPRPEGRVQISGPENAVKRLDRGDCLAGTDADGRAVRADVGRTGVSAELRTQHRRGAFRRAADDSGVSDSMALRMHAVGALFLSCYGTGQYP